MKVVLIPFSRDIQLSEKKVPDGAQRIAEMGAHLRLCQVSRAVVCLARESRLSLELKAEVRLVNLSKSLLRVERHNR